MTTHNAIEPLLPSSRTHDYRAALEMLCALDRSAYEHRTLKEGANWERRTQLYEFVQGRVQMNRIAEMDLRVFALNTLLKGGLIASPATSGMGCRVGTRFLPRRRRFNCIWQYTRHTLLWFHGRPRRRMIWNSLSKPRSGNRSANSASSAMTGSSRSGRAL